MSSLAFRTVVLSRDILARLMQNVSLNRLLYHRAYAVCGNVVQSTSDVVSIRRVSTSAPSIPDAHKPQFVNDGQVQAAAQTNHILPRVRQAQDIAVNDLQATLEAHRARNRENTIRKILVPPLTAKVQPCDWQEELNYSGDLKKPLLQETDINANSQSTNEAKKKISLPLWPADSIQAWRMGAIDARRYARTSRSFRNEEVLEYRGTPQRTKSIWKILPDNEGQISRRISRPWLGYLEHDSDDPHQRLSQEIRAFEAYMRLTPAEELASNIIFSDLSAALEPFHRSTLIGSRSTGLATPISDLDVSVEVDHSHALHAWKGWSVESRSRRRIRTEMLLLLRETLSISQAFSRPKLIYARVPIVQAKHIATNLKIQLQITAPPESQQAHTTAVLEEIPSLRPLYIALRYALEIRNLTTVYEGGLGSYSLLIMIVTALKHANEQFASDDLARQLLHVLKFWGMANTYDTGYSVNPGGIIAKKNDGLLNLNEYLASSGNPFSFNLQKPYLLCLQDPADYHNDLGRNVYAIKHIQATLLAMHDKIQKIMFNMPYLFRPTTRQTRNLLGPLVQADYGHFELHRTRVERYSMPGKGSDIDESPQSIMKDAAERAKLYRERHGHAGVSIKRIPQPTHFRTFKVA